MSWKTQKEEGKLGCCGRGVTRACSRSGSTFAPRPSAACGASLPPTASPCVGTGPLSPLARGGQWGTDGSWEEVGNKMRLESWKLFPTSIQGQVTVTRWAVSHAAGAAQLLWDH